MPYEKYPVEANGIPYPAAIRWLANIALIAWLLCLALPALGPNSNDISYGFQILLIGWLSLFVVNFGWLANVFMIIVVLRVRANSYLPLWTSPAIVISTFRAIYWGFYGSIPNDNGGENVKIRCIGFYIWIGSMIVAAVLPPISRRMQPERFIGP